LWSYHAQFIRPKVPAGSQVGARQALCREGGRVFYFLTHSSGEMAMKSPEAADSTSSPSIMHRRCTRHLCCKMHKCVTFSIINSTDISNPPKNVCPHSSLACTTALAQSRVYLQHITCELPIASAKKYLLLTLKKEPVL